MFNTNAYIMLYELESSPFAQKSSTVNKLKMPGPTPEFNQLNSSSSSGSSNTNNSNVPKTLTNGIGFTSDKVYGPELPPDRLEKKTNGSVPPSETNGNMKHTSISVTSDSDSEGDHVINATSSENKTVKLPAPIKDTDISSTCNDAKSSISLIKSGSPISSPNVSTSASSLSSPESTPKTTNEVCNTNPTATKSLVPYESDDTSSSDDSNQSAQEIESRVSTKAAVGDWQVSSSTDVNHEPSSAGKSWERKKLQMQQNSQNPVNELFKMSHSGYSAPVSSWNGTRSQLDKEVLNERREERKRSLADSSDQGRVKHQKLNSNYKSNPGYNPIQVGNYFFCFHFIFFC